VPNKQKREIMTVMNGDEAGNRKRLEKKKSKEEKKYGLDYFGPHKKLLFQSQNV